MAEANHVDYTLQLQPDNVLLLAWHPGVRIEAQNARAAVDAVNGFAGGTRYPLLVRMANASHLSRAARDVFIEPCAASKIALLGENAVDRILVDYQLAAQPAPCPTRFFTSEAEATAWLLEGQPAGESLIRRAGSLGGSSQ
ncbi:STAS/SEC14 domain-containing protein [Arthrobacter sp. FW305-123]|nr:STAS/SEC14 domain-containing protein [Arthrobacter sp. FW305-123]